MKKFLKRLFLALLKEELEALEIDYKARLEVVRVEIAHDLLNDNSFIYDLSKEVIEEGEIEETIKDQLREELEALEARIEDLEEGQKKY